MPLALVIADTADGTGGSATISGSAGGATNTVYYTPWNGVMASVNWTLGGTRTGDGAIPLTIGVGYFLFQLVSNGVLGPIAYKNFTAPLIDAVHYRLLIGAQTRINELSLVGLDATKILVKWLPRASDVDLAMLPLVCISPPGFEVNVSEVMNQDDFLYPCIVAIMVNQKQDSVANLKTVLKWREQINRALCYQRLAGITEMMWAEPKLMNVVDPESFVTRNILLSALGFGFRIRQTRGLT